MAETLTDFELEVEHCEITAICLFHVSGFALFQRAVTIVEFAALELGRTRVTITNEGRGAGGRFDALYCLCEWGNAYTLQALKKRFGTGPLDRAAKKAKLESKTAARPR
jgi:hypothetical protein